MVRAPKRRTRLFGSSLIALALLWQVLAVVHLAFDTHSLCPEHGAVAHANAKTGQLDHHESGPFESQDACQVLVALATSGYMPAAGVAIAQALVSLEPPPCARPRESVATPALRELYRLAPSQSPPASA